MTQTVWLGVRGALEFAQMTGTPREPTSATLIVAESSSHSVRIPFLFQKAIDTDSRPH
eukprot:COSAG02_NODE_37_length_48203_cov_57.745708_35_plen_58_part_00